MPRKIEAVQRRRVPRLAQGGRLSEGLGVGRGQRGLTHRAAPNRPAGFTSSTPTMMTKITVDEASG